ncbi:MAG: glycosyltransferase family 2 protein [Saprospiraceae bacterium]|nr:glycosyltransferase family 2 protein [Saprospiraceae bacterium]
MAKLFDIRILIPAYNEATVIGAVIAGLQGAGFAHILVIDDGSTDNTATAAKAMGAQVIRHATNRGAGAAIQTGLMTAKRKKWPLVALMDADGQHHAEDIVVMKDAMDASGYDLVIGSRFLHLENEIPGSRIFFNRVGNMMTNLMCKNKYTDSQSGLRLLNQYAIEKLELHIDGFGYCSEMIHQAEKRGLTIGEAPTRVLYSKYSLNKGQDFEVGITTAISFIWKILFGKQH